MGKPKIHERNFEVASWGFQWGLDGNGPWANAFLYGLYLDNGAYLFTRQLLARELQTGHGKTGHSACTRRYFPSVT